MIPGLDKRLVGLDDGLSCLPEALLPLALREAGAALDPGVGAAPTGQAQ